MGSWACRSALPPAEQDLIIKKNVKHTRKLHLSEPTTLSNAPRPQQAGAGRDDAAGAVIGARHHLGHDKLLERYACIWASTLRVT